MNCGDMDTMTGTGLRFFGKVSASISHEIKNSLAVINESAGLLEDLTLMAEKGVPLNPERIKAVAGKVMNQIKRADGIVKKMNMFAHTVDEPVRGVELGEMVDLACHLSSRVAAMKGLVLEAEMPTQPIHLITNPFFLQNVIGLFLEFAIGTVEAGKAVKLVPEKAEKGCRVVLKGLEGIKGGDSESFPAGVDALVQILKAGYEVNAERGELILSLPGAIGTQSAVGE